MQRTYNGWSTFFTYEKDREKKLFACGWNAYGKLGLGHNRNVTVPEEVKLETTVSLLLTIPDVATT